MPGDEEGSSEAKYAAKRSFPDKVCEEERDDGRRKFLHIGIDTGTLREQGRGAGGGSTGEENGWSQASRRCQVCVLTLCNKSTTVNSIVGSAWHKRLSTNRS